MNKLWELYGWLGRVDFKYVWSTGMLTLSFNLGPNLSTNMFFYIHAKYRNRSLRLNTNRLKQFETNSNLDCFSNERNIIILNNALQRWKRIVQFCYITVIRISNFVHKITISPFILWDVQLVNTKIRGILNLKQRKSLNIYNSLINWS